MQEHKENIYCGIITEKVHVMSIRPNIYLQTQQIIKNSSILQGTLSALKFRYPLKYLGAKYSEILMPCIPGIQHEVKENNTKEEQEKCFIKVPFETETKVIASGKRSAIFINNNKMLRYKGCGNELKGFNIENNQIRGSHFFYTAKRQLYMTEMINTIFQEELRICPPANKPIFCYNFPQKQLSKLQGISNQCSIIDKYCCVFETQGDRRAGTHLISPLEVFYLNLFDSSKVNWKQIFNTKNRIQDGQLVEIVTNFELFMEDGLKFIDIYDNSSEISNYITIKEIQDLAYLQNIPLILQEIINKFVPESFKDEMLEKVRNIKKWKQSIEAILYRIGWQMGQIKRIMCQKGISWGFFNDHGSQWHSNAHLNNFIVTKPQLWQQSSNFFLLPLDYDFAYTKQQFINIELDSDKYGTNDENMFENYLCAEYNTMEMSLFGMELMSNFTYTIQEEKQKKEEKKMSRICFRDTLVQAFTQGMRKKKQKKEGMIEKWNQNIEDIKSIVQVCLYVSVNFQT